MLPTFFFSFFFLQKRNISWLTSEICPTPHMINDTVFYEVFFCMCVCLMMKGNFKEIDTHKNKATISLHKWNGNFIKRFKINIILMERPDRTEQIIFVRQEFNFLLMDYIYIFLVLFCIKAASFTISVWQNHRHVTDMSQIRTSVGVTTQILFGACVIDRRARFSRDVAESRWSNGTPER